MKRLLKNGTVVNVFTDTLEKANVLMENEMILGVGDYTDEDADVTEDIDGKYVCPGFIDSHIHIESTMMVPAALAKISLLHGTTAVVADPHEIANVMGVDGIRLMLGMAEGLPLHFYFMLPSCVPATKHDEPKQVLTAEELYDLYENKSVLGLAEVMDFLAVMGNDPATLKKIADAKAFGKRVDGHAPLLGGKALDRYLVHGIESDHECSSFEEALEKLRKGQRIMIRQGTAARNLQGLIELFDEPYNRRCLLCTDDKHPADLLREGHIDSILRRLPAFGKSVLAGIRMCTIQASEYFGLRQYGAIAPGFRADILVLDDLETVDVRDVYIGGEKAVDNKKTIAFDAPKPDTVLAAKAFDSFHTDKLTASDFIIEPQGSRCHVIGTVKGQLLTENRIEALDFTKDNGVDTSRDIIKISVIERHNHTGHKFVGFIHGIGFKNGAVAASVSHDSHNIVVIGANESDMAAAVNHLIDNHGGYAVACDGEIIGELALPAAGLMSFEDAETLAAKNETLLETLGKLGADSHFTLMMMTFVSLPVIPNLKITAKGLVDVNCGQILPLFASENESVSNGY